MRLSSTTHWLGREPTMRVGETVMLRMGPAETTWRVVGLAREAFSPAVAYIPLSFIQQRHPGNGEQFAIIARQIRSGFNRYR